MGEITQWEVMLGDTNHTFRDSAESGHYDRGRWLKLPDRNVDKLRISQAKRLRGEQMLRIVSTLDGATTTTFW